MAEFSAEHESATESVQGHMLDAAVPAYLCNMNCIATCRGDSVAAAQLKTSTSRS